MIGLLDGQRSEATRYVVVLSISSRALLLLIQFLANISIQDHNADAYRNSYHEKLSATLNNSTHTTSSINYPSDEGLNIWHLSIYRAISGLTNWDSQYFLDITVDGYKDHKDHRHLAFLPLFPTIVSYVKRLIFLQWNTSSKLTPGIDLTDYIWSALIGIILNNFIFFPIASLILFNLTRRVVSNNDQYARQVIKWFCFNPASIFFSAYYSESLFAALGFTSMLLLDTTKDQHQPGLKRMKVDKSNSQNQLALLKLYLPCLITIAFCSFTRSNGIVLLGYVFFHIFTHNGLLLDKRVILTYPVIFIRKLFCSLPAVLTCTAISIIPFMLFQLYSHDKICSSSEDYRHLRPDWCDDMISHPYGWLQARYWNVGLFKYYTWKQIPNFLLALPITLLILLNCLRLKIFQRIPLKQVPYYLHGVTLTIFCILTINVQVTTRIIASSCPVLYWICADLANRSRLNEIILIVYFGTYFLLGALLHSNFYPWT